MSSIGRKAVFKGALYKRMADQGHAEHVKTLVDYVTNDPGMRPALSSIIIASRIYLESGAYQRFQCIDKMWTPLCALARRSMAGQGVAGTFSVAEVRTAAALLCDFFMSEPDQKAEGGQ